MEEKPHFWGIFDVFCPYLCIQSLRVSEISYTVNPRISPRGLIVNFEILHGGLIEGGLIRGRGLIENNNFLHVG